MLATYPPRLELPYRVSRAWLEERTLAGDVVTPIHTLHIETDQLSPDLRERAAALAKRVSRGMLDWNPPTKVEVIGSGIDPWDQATDENGREVRPTDAVINRIGELPELPLPTDSGGELIEAYERWVARYVDLSLGALAAWIDRWAVEGEPDEEGNAPNGLPIRWWVRWVHYRIGGKKFSLEVDGRTHLELFHQLVAASQLHSHAQSTAGEDDLKVALDIVDGPLQMKATPASPDDVVAAYADYEERLTNLAFARHWTRQRQREGFDLEMRRWAFEQGSERLQIGISDEYRMVPVYLTERISSEMPGFYAHLTKKDDKHGWQPRTGPSEEALRLRRAVQDRLERYSPPGGPIPTAEIGWMKNPPVAMCDRRHAYATDEWGNRENDIMECAFEIVAVRNWLGRYTLIAGVHTQADDQPPDFLLLKYVLNPQDYELDDVPLPPGGDSLAQNRVASAFTGVADDDIPF